MAVPRGKLCSWRIVLLVDVVARAPRTNAQHERSERKREIPKTKHYGRRGESIATVGIVSREAGGRGTRRERGERNRRRPKGSQDLWCFFVKSPTHVYPRKSGDEALFYESRRAHG